MELNCDWLPPKKKTLERKDVKADVPGTLCTYIQICIHECIYIYGYIYIVYIYKV